MAVVDGYQIVLTPVGTPSTSPLVTVWAGYHVRQTYAEGQEDGFAEGYAQGSLVAPPPEDSTEVTFAATNLSGPVTGLSPTWVCYFNAATGSLQPEPAITEVGGGGYKFTPSGQAPAGIIDFGATVLPRYYVFASISNYKAFPAFDIDKEPLAGLTPTWLSLKKVSDGSDYPQPDITPLGFGLYRTGWTADHTVGVIDLGATAYPRYYEYDSEIAALFLVGYADGELYGFSSQRNEHMQPIAPGETDVLKKTITFMVYTDSGVPASGNPGEGAVYSPSVGEIQVNKNLAGYVDAAGTFAHIADGKYRYVFHDNEVSGSTEGYVLFRLKADGHRTLTVETPLRVTTAAASTAASILSTVGSIQTTTTELHKIAVGRWKVFNNQLTLYDVDGTTPLRVFDLLDDEENPSQTKIFERLPVP